MGRAIIRIRVALTLLGATAIAACGYFNTMYNADRSFSDAERAVIRGDFTTARTAYTRATEKALRSLEKDSLGRYSDDALLIVGRSLFALDQMDSARTALTKLAGRSDSRLSHAARAWLGATTAAQGQHDAALTSLNAALSAEKLDHETTAFARLWRARVHHQLKDRTAALQDIDDSARSDHRFAAPAALLGARIALETRDTATLRAQFNALFASERGGVFIDSIRALTTQYADSIEPQALATAMSGIDRANWQRMRRDSVALLRVALLQHAGDTTRAIAEAQRIANRSTPPVSDDARYLAARMMLTSTNDTDRLTEIRNLLLPALAHAEARTLVQTLKTIDVLLESAAGSGQPLALFVAAEISRDQLHAPGLARRLFVTYAEVARDAAWAGKALLAALALPQAPDSADALRARIESMSGNVYVAALNGEDDNAAFADAEDRLARTAIALRNAATLQASQRETVVGRSVALIDSVRQAAQTDSVRISCGVLMDSLAVTGIRADSIRSACMRRDRERIDILMKVDTVMLRDSAATRTDSLRTRGDTLRARPDTITDRQ